MIHNLGTPNASRRPLPTRCVPLDRRRPSVSIQRVRSRYTHELRNEVVEELICDQGGKSRAYLNIELVRSGRKRRKEREKGRRGEESKKNQEKRPQGSMRR